jgi:hypothetical protein
MRALRKDEAAPRVALLVRKAAKENARPPENRRPGTVYSHFFVPWSGHGR